MYPQQGQQPSNKTDLIFCYTEHKPETLVMLYPPERIVQKMLKPSIPVHVLWINDNMQTGQRARADQIQKQTGVTIILLAGITQLEKFLMKNKQVSKAVIVCCPKIFQYVKFTDRRQQITTAILYPVPAKEEEEDECFFLNENQENEAKSKYKQKKQGLFVYDAENQQQLFQLIREQCITKPEYKGLMNFVALNGEVEKSNILVRTLLAMINQPVDQNTRVQIVNHFEKIVNKTLSSTEVRLLVQQLSKGPLSTQRALYWYFCNLEKRS